jgi:hypothetical protein
MAKPQSACINSLKPRNNLHFLMTRSKRMDKTFDAWKSWNIREMPRHVSGASRDFAGNTKTSLGTREAGLKHGAFTASVMKGYDKFAASS